MSSGFERGTEQEYVYCKMVREMGGLDSKHIRHSPVNPYDKHEISNAKEVRRIVETRHFAICFGDSVDGNDGYGIVSCCTTPRHTISGAIYRLAQHDVIEKFVCLACGARTARRRGDD